MRTIHDPSVAERLVKSNRYAARLGELDARLVGVPLGVEDGHGYRALLLVDAGFARPRARVTLVSDLQSATA